MASMLHNCCTHIFIYCSSCLLAAIHIINAIDKTHIRQIIQSMVNTTTVGGSNALQRYNVTTVTPIHVSGLDSDYECRVLLAGQGVRLHSCHVGSGNGKWDCTSPKTKCFSHITSAQCINQRCGGTSSFPTHCRNQWVLRTFKRKVVCH